MFSEPVFLPTRSHRFRPLETGMMADALGATELLKPREGPDQGSSAFRVPSPLPPPPAHQHLLPLRGKEGSLAPWMPPPTPAQEQDLAWATEAHDLLLHLSPGSSTFPAPGGVGEASAKPNE